MKPRAVIFQPDHTNDVVVLNKKQFSGRTFRRNGNMYFIHPDRFQITWERYWWRGWMKSYYSTSYYIHGICVPLPVPNFQPILKGKKPSLDENGKIQNDFKDIVDMGVPAEELSAIFNPYFLKVIGNVGATKTEQIALTLLVVILLGIVYVAGKLGGVF